MIIGCYSSWYAPWANNSQDFSLSQIPELYPGVDCVNITYVKPDMVYTFGSFQGTGLQFTVEFGVVVGAIKILKAKGVTVMLCIGGSSYWVERKRFNAQECIRLADDLGCDGIDIDWAGNVNRAYELTDAVKSARVHSTRLLSISGFSTGAFPRTSADIYCGMNIDALTRAGNLIDWVNIKTFNAGPNYDPGIALYSYRTHYSGPLNVGFMIGEPGWGGYKPTLADVEKWGTQFNRESVKNGCFIQSLAGFGDPSDIEVIQVCNTIFKPPLINMPQILPLPTGNPIQQNLMTLTCPSCKAVFTKQS